MDNIDRWKRALELKSNRCYSLRPNEIERAGRSCWRPRQINAGKNKRSSMTRQKASFIEN